MRSAYTGMRRKGKYEVKIAILRAFTAAAQPRPIRFRNAARSGAQSPGEAPRSALPPREGCGRQSESQGRKSASAAFHPAMDRSAWCAAGAVVKHARDTSEVGKFTRKPVPRQPSTNSPCLRIFCPAMCMGVQLRSTRRPQPERSQAMPDGRPTQQPNCRNRRSCR
jgi:hypothetical protein